jgi:hypothetical protein
MNTYIHQSHLFCECSEKKKMGEHVCPACWAAAPEELRKTVTGIEPGCLRHVAAVAELIAHAQRRHPTITTIPYCPRCNRCQIKPPGANELKWIHRPECFNAKPGWKLENTVCPECATDHVVIDA